ncbi:MAG: hypothetical protein LH472_00255 [Pyrinomonadaceae bacterium]|nr:hypothetical protein [Pyrinomonadaceae bacterium]
MQSETKQNQEKVPNVNQEGWNIAQVAEESTNKPSDEMVREVLRGDESKGDADERDVVGSVDSNETPQGREEAKKDETRSDS